MKIVVLGGGISTEREVALVTSTSVCKALRTLGPNTLADVGCKLTQEDAFFYELNEAELEGSRT